MKRSLDSWWIKQTCLTRLNLIDQFKDQLKHSYVSHVALQARNLAKQLRDSDDIELAKNILLNYMTHFIYDKIDPIEFYHLRYLARIAGRMLEIGPNFVSKEIQRREFYLSEYNSDIIDELLPRAYNLRP